MPKSQIVNLKKIKPLKNHVLRNPLRNQLRNPLRNLLRNH